MSDDLPYRVFELHGYSPWSAQEILRAAERGTPIAEMPGDFVAVARGKDDKGKPIARIVSSVVAALPYYYAPHVRGPLAHGPTVFDVVRDAKLAWAWNPRAIGSLALLEHAVGEDSIHADVMRVPPATVITSDGERVTIARQDAWPQMLARADATEPDAAVGVLAGVFTEMAAPRPVVSLTSGFDSRLLLGLALRAGLRPRALTMGFAHSTDVKVARAITGALGLEHQVVELKPEDYLANARAIVRRTSGAKTANHWHTDLYVRAAGLGAETVHYVGSNGELARSFYFDRGAVSRAAFALPAAAMVPFFAAKMQKRARRLPRALVALGPAPNAFARHAAGLVTPMARSFGDALDAFYTTQRVRHLVGMGLALYSAHCRARSPFLDARWIRAALHLPREERLGSNYHRRALAAVYPALLAFPIGEGGEGASMATRAPRLYHARKAANVTYSVYAQVLADPRVQEVVIESRGLDELIARPERIAIARGQSPAMASLLALHFAREIARET